MAAHLARNMPEEAAVAEAAHAVAGEVLAHRRRGGADVQSKVAAGLLARSRVCQRQLRAIQCRDDAQRVSRAGSATLARR